MDWADLPIIDFSKASTPEGRAELAPRVCDVMRTVGFMCLVNHGLTQTQVSAILGTGSDVAHYTADRSYLRHRGRRLYPSA